MKKLLRESVNFLPPGVRTRIKYLPGIAALQRWLVGRIISGGSFLHTINAGPAAGLRFEITLPLDKAIWAGSYEPEFARAIARQFKHGDVCYDIGGYRGYMAGVMALAGASRVLTFEPLPMNQNALRRLCQLNPALPIELIPMAVGDVDGLTILKVMAELSMGKLNSSSFQAEFAFQDKIEVGIRSIDMQVTTGTISPLDLIKVDVEGAELDASEVQLASSLFVGLQFFWKPILFRLNSHVRKRFGIWVTKFIVWDRNFAATIMRAI